MAPRSRVIGLVTPVPKVIRFVTMAAMPSMTYASRQIICESPT